MQWNGRSVWIFFSTVKERGRVQGNFRDFAERSPSCKKIKKKKKDTAEKRSVFSSENAFCGEIITTMVLRREKLA